MFYRNLSGTTQSLQCESGSQYNIKTSPSYGDGNTVKCPTQFVSSYKFHT